jgi:hypothetical protein
MVAIRAGRGVVGAVALACVGLVVFALVGATGGKVPALAFTQSGHWVYNQLLGAVFHVDGGSMQVDARVELPDAGEGTHVTLQGADHGFTVGGGGIKVFDKSSLSVDTTIPATIDEEPVGIEVVGGPYLVYRLAGTVVRLGMSPSVIQVGGPVADPVRVDDGTVWVRRTDTNALCRVQRDSTVLVCPAVAPEGHTGAMAVVRGRASFVDTTDDAVVAVADDHLDLPVRLPVDLPSDGRVADTETGGKLAVLDPSKDELLLVDTAGRGSRSVDLGAGKFSSPVPVRDAVAVVNEDAGTLLTYDLDGRRQAEVRVAEPGQRVTVVRGEDGRVYVDDGRGVRTHVVDRGGVVTTVSTGEPEAPTAPPTNPPPPPVQPPPTSKPPEKNPTPPGAPAGVQAQAGDAKVAVSWGAAEPNGAAVTAYHVSWTVLSGGGTNGTMTTGGKQLTTVLSGLRNGAVYRVTVFAENAAGRGPGVDSAPVTPTSDTPDRATAVRAVAKPDGTVDLTWQPADGQGRQIKHYTVEAVGADGSTTQVAQVATPAAAVDAGLALGTRYTFVVTAVNDAGVAGPKSDPSNPVTPYSPASAPGNLAATGKAQAADLTWTAPNLHGGELVHYVVSAPGVPPTTATTTRVTVAGLRNGTTYRFSVHAVTRERGAANGPTVDGDAASTEGKPGRTPVVNVAAATLSGDREVTVRLSVEDNDSGAVTCRVLFNGGERWRGGCSGTKDVKVGGLDYSQTYDVAATGSNSYGESTPAAKASVRTNDKPQPSIEVTKGTPMQRPPTECIDPSCAYVHVKLKNFGGDQVVECWEDQGKFRTYTARQADTEVCFFGYPGRTVWVKVGSVESNHFRWS